MSHGNDPNGFIHDLSVLVSDGLKDSCSVMHMAKKIGEVGLGSQESFGADEFKKACESAMNSISGIKLNNFANYLIIEKVKSTNNYYKSRYFVEAYFSSIYQFDQLKTGKKNKISTPAKIIMGISNSGDSEKIKLGCEHGRSISVGVNIAKDLGNLPANICTPTYLANQSKKFAKMLTLFFICHVLLESNHQLRDLLSTNKIIQ